MPKRTGILVFARQLVVVTTDTFLGVEGVAREARLVDNTACAVREGENDLVLQIRIKDSGEKSNCSQCTLVT